tara:strand:+ start:164 stop:700 length:537 start_codon:yes stop_codon:yes gene_type:complete
MNLNKIPVGKNPPEEVNVVIEVPSGGHPVKYEMDKDTQCITVDRFLHTPMRYPANYGFIPQTLGDDGDPLDVLVVAQFPLVSGCVIAVRPIGVLEMEDDGGGDEKIVAVPITKLDPYYKDIQEIENLPAILKGQIQHFFEHYKDLEPGKWVKVSGWGDAERARELITKGINSGKSVAA